MREHMKDDMFNPVVQVIFNAELMETMFNLVGPLRESHALFINEQHVEWNILLLRLYHIHCQSQAMVDLIPVKLLKELCDSGIIVDNIHKYDPVDDVECVEHLLTRIARYTRFAFNRFEDNSIVMEVIADSKISDLLIIDIRLYSPGRTGLMNYTLIKLLNTGDINNLDGFVGMEMNPYQCTTQRLWNIITRSPKP
jgi:hypothetical protein